MKTVFVAFADQNAHLTLSSSAREQRDMRRGEVGSPGQTQAQGGAYPGAPGEDET